MKNLRLFLIAPKSWKWAILLTLVCASALALDHSVAAELSTTPTHLQGRLISDGKSITTLSESQILANQADTVCLIKQLEAPPAKEAGFINALTGQLFIGSDLSAKMMHPKLAYSKEPGFDNQIPIRIGEIYYLLIMEKDGDAIVLDNDSHPLLGVGSILRFASNEWTTLLGKQFRNGWATITASGLQTSPEVETQKAPLPSAGSPSAEPKETHKFTGTVVMIDLSARTLSIMLIGMGVEMTFNCVPDVKLKGIKKGSIVEVEMLKQSGPLTAIRVTVLK